MRKRRASLQATCKCVFSSSRFEQISHEVHYGEERYWLGNAPAGFAMS